MQSQSPCYPKMDSGEWRNPHYLTSPWSLFAQCSDGRFSISLHSTQHFVSAPPFMRGWQLLQASPTYSIGRPEPDVDGNIPCISSLPPPLRQSRLAWTHRWLGFTCSGFMQHHFTGCLARSVVHNSAFHSKEPLSSFARPLETLIYRQQMVLASIPTGVWVFVPECAFQALTFPSLSLSLNTNCSCCFSPPSPIALSHSAIRSPSLSQHCTAASVKSSATATAAVSHRNP